MDYNQSDESINVEEKDKVPKSIKWKSVLLIIGASFLWALDAFVRYPVGISYSRIQLAFFEHFFGSVFLLPFFLLKTRHEFKKIKPSDIVFFLGIGVTGSALASMSMNESMSLIGVAIPTVFQMVQPLFVVLLASLVLNEKRASFFFPIAVWVVINAILFSVPEIQKLFEFDEIGPKQIKGLWFGFLSMLLWGFSTVSGKVLISKFSRTTVIFFRWSLAMIFIYGFLVKKGLHIDFEGVFTNFSLLWRLLFMGIISGVFAFYLYYEGMKHLPVGVVTFIELSYPFLGTLMLGLTTNGISSIQIIAAIMLVVSISLLLGLELKD